MERQIILRALCRSNKDSILKICRLWKLLSNDTLTDVNLKQPKIRIAEDIYDLCQKLDTFTIDRAGDLDLIYSQLHSDNRKWSVYELRRQDESHYISHPETFRKSLTSKMKLIFDKVYVNVNLYGGALWARVHIMDKKDKKQYKPNDVVYLVHYPRTHIVILSRIKLSLEDNFTEALLPVFKAEDVHCMHLVGKHVSSLAELALNKHCQGSFGNFRAMEERENPLSRKTKRKRKEPPPQMDDRISCENVQEKKHRSEVLNDTFGTATQPTLEKLEYKLEVKFRGSKHAPAMEKSDDSFRCRVKFEGTSVLEGIRELGKAGLADVPLPSHLSKVNSLAKNFFVIRDKNGKQNVTKE